MTQTEIETSIPYTFETNAKSLREHLIKMSFTATKKNKIVDTQLKSELHRIDRQAQNDIRMYKNQQQRFKNKYSKFDPFNEKRGSEASDVRMYETHIPGFCYRRDGASRIPNPVANNQSVDFQDLHDMLFTNLEVDVEKVMILHLLSAHRIDTLDPPPKCYSLFLSREQSPLERLVERSKKKIVTNNRVSKMLPTFVLDVKVDESDPEMRDLKPKNIIKDPRLVNRLILNDKILQLCDTVMSALQKSNGKRMNDLVELSKNTERLKSLLNATHLQDFIRTLSGLNLISSCESFYLTLPFKTISVTIPAKTSTGILEKLVLQIRKNIFQVPSIDSWSVALSDSFNMSSDTLEEVKGTTEAFVKPKVDHILGRNTERKSFSPKVSGSIDGSIDGEDSNRRKSTVSTYSVRKRRSKQLSEDEIEFDKYIDRTMKYLNKPPTYNPPVKEEKVIAETSPVLKERDDYSEFNVDDLLFTQIFSDNQIEKPVAISEEAGPSVLTDIPEEDDEERTMVDHSKHVKAHTNCAACMAKWKRPLPTPKTPTITKTSIPKLDESNLAAIRTDSMHKLSSLVTKNKNKLAYYERRFSKESKLERQSLNKVRRSSLGSQGSSRRTSVEIVDLDKLDLAKIRQEIKENETQKKLDKFIKNQEMLNRRSSIKGENLST